MIVKTEVNHIHSGCQIMWELANALCISAVQHKHSYGGDQSQWEVAVIDYSRLIGDFDIVRDVRGYMTFDEVIECRDKMASMTPQEVRKMISRGFAHGTEEV